MENRIIIRKLSFYHHVVSLEKSSVANSLASIAEMRGYPGLMKEYKALCSDLKLPNPSKVSQQSWKKLVRKAVTEANRLSILALIEEKYEKLDYQCLKTESFGKKEYIKNMNMHDGRLKFRIRCKMVKHVAFNFSSDPVYSNKLWLCPHCDRMDSQSHVLCCESYSHLREGKDLKSDSDLVKYFGEVLSLREKIDDLV